MILAELIYRFREQGANGVDGSPYDEDAARLSVSLPLGWGSETAAEGSR